MTLKANWEITISKGREEISPGRREMPGKPMSLEKQSLGEEMPLWSKRRGLEIYRTLVWESLLKHALKIFNSEFPIWKLQVTLENLPFCLVLK